MTKFYECIAYRYGFSNNHWYTLYVGDDKEKAIAMAENEASERSGKYGVEVREWDGNDYAIIAHASSVYGEKRAYTNAVIHARQDFGATCQMAVEDGHVLVSDENRKGYCKRVPLSLPPELASEWKRHLEIGQMLEQHDKEVPKNQ